MAKFIEITTGKKVELIEDKDVFYQPHLGTLKNLDGSIYGHSYVPAYWDREGNEYRKCLERLARGSVTELKIDYTKGENK